MRIYDISNKQSDIKFMKNVEQGYVVMANDGDADRYGVIDEKGNYIFLLLCFLFLRNHVVMYFQTYI